MDIWNSTNWKTYLGDKPVRRGIRLRFDKEVHPEVRTAVMNFVKWLRLCYEFPLRVRVYVFSTEKIKAKDGDLVYGTFFRPYKYGEEPYIRIATGDYLQLFDECGRDDALATILGVLAHEFSHYYQYINQCELTPKGEELQARYFEKEILWLYSQTRDHP